MEPVSTYRLTDKNGLRFPVKRVEIFASRSRDTTSRFGKKREKKSSDAHDSCYEILRVSRRGKKTDTDQDRSNLPGRVNQNLAGTRLPLLPAQKEQVRDDSLCARGNAPEKWLSALAKERKCRSNYSNGGLQTGTSRNYYGE
uniref:Uncharacterized protein n=1 Tax=Vespula pensylvanica TaxID=30213 RepID=A0A834U813_VESPE|nr:hypothetical protein H0235_009204 [Vespula pensylvanica]